MEYQNIKISTIRPNPDNPRVIHNDDFKSLVESIKRDPEFLEKRGMVCADGMILGGNQRYRAIQEALRDPDFRSKLGLKYNEIRASWVQDASEWSEEKRRRFIIIDNGEFGEWDKEKLANEYWDLPLIDLGVDLPEDFLKEPEPPGEEGDGKENEKMTTCPKCGYEYAI